MNKKLGKVVMLGCMTAATLATAVSSTFAFVTMNQEAKVSEFDFDIETQEGLLISLDGKNFYQDISYEMITKAIEYNVNGTYSQYVYHDVNTKKDTLDPTNAEKNAAGEPIKYPTKKFNELKFTPVTVSPNTDAGHAGEVNYIDYNYSIGEDVMNSTKISTDKRLEFVKDSLKAGTDPTGLNDVWYEHEMKPAYEVNNGRVTSSDYIYFDLWFTVATNGITDAADAPTYKLKMKNDADRPMFEGTDTKVKLYNDLTTQTQTYHSGDEITVNTADAMRLAIVTQESKTDSTKPGLYVYEPSKKSGLGSVAVNDTKLIYTEPTDATAPAVVSQPTDPTDSNYATDLAAYNQYLTDLDTYNNLHDQYLKDKPIYDKYVALSQYVPAYVFDKDGNDNNLYNPAMNAMYTYYNATHPLSPFTKAADWNESFDTKDEYYNDIYATLNYHPAVAGTNSLASYDVVKLSVAIWLEGWDADYFMGISANSVKVKLGFEVVAEE